MSFLQNKHFPNYASSKPFFTICQSPLLQEINPPSNPKCSACSLQFTNAAIVSLMLVSHSNVVSESWGKNYVSSSTQKVPGWERRLRLKLDVDNWDGCKATNCFVSNHFLIAFGAPKKIHATKRPLKNRSTPSLSRKVPRGTPARVARRRSPSAWQVERAARAAALRSAR